MKQSLRTFALVAIVVFILLMMHQLPTLKVGGTELRHVNILSQILPPLEERQVDVVPVTVAPEPMTPLASRGGKVNFKEKWRKGVEPIVDFSGGKAGGMDHFYAMLDSVGRLGRPVRIAYFGDSYIEGDIMTADLREMLQERFGGNGVGWLDAGSSVNVRSRRSITQKISGFTEHVVVKKPFDEAKEGIAEKYYEVGEGAYLSLSGSRFYRHTSQWTSATLFLRTASSVTVEATASDGRRQTHVFPSSPSVQMWNLTGSMSGVDYRFSQVGDGTLLYGVALESDRGVVLDNFSMRGSSGITLAKLPARMLEDFRRHRPYDLIILQFGLNDAVTGNTLPILQLYMGKLRKAVSHLRECFPEASILIASVPDRDQRTSDGIQTLPEVKNLVRLQEQLAADCHVAYLNFWRAMGGQNSVKALVDRDMATKDYTHLSFGGGAVVARRVYPSFIGGLDNYLRRREAERRTAE